MRHSLLYSFLLATSLVPSLFAGDPFLGKWKLNLAKSKLAGQTIEIQETGGGYKFKEDEHSDIIFADGLDHPTHFGETMSITQKKPDTWAITYKKGDAVLMNTLWKVSRDGHTLIYKAEGTRPNGQHFDNELKAKRISGGPGLAGTWETVSVNLSSPREIYIEPYESDGYFITYPGRQQTMHMKFDGKDYPEEGPTVAEGSTSLGRRVGANTTETTEKIKGRIIEVAKATVSSDGRTQTIIVTEPGDPTPVVLVYEREANPK